MKSVDMSANDAIIKIEEMATPAEITAFIEGDTRKTVLAFADARLNALTADQNKGGGAPSEEPRQATVAHTNVQRFHKTEKPRVFAKGETIPPDWYDTPAGMRTE